MNLSSVDKGVWVRLISMVLLTANMISVTFFNFQLIPFEDEKVYEGVSVTLTVLMSFYTLWKNNSFTENAQIADEFRKQLDKEGGK